MGRERERENRTWGSSMMKSWALAIFAAARTSSSVASGFPKRMFSSIEPKNSTGSWETMPMFDRSHCRLIERMSTPSKRTFWKRTRIVDLPLLLPLRSLVRFPDRRSVESVEWWYFCHSPTGRTGRRFCPLESSSLDRWESNRRRKRTVERRTRSSVPTDASVRDG